MTVGNLLDRIREIYVSQLSRAIAEKSSDARTRVIIEPALRDATGKAVGEGRLGLPMRVDMVITRDGKPIDTFRVPAHQILSFKPIVFDWPGGVEVELTPFQWDDARISAHGVSESVGVKPLADWFFRWFKDDVDSNDLAGAVHFMSDPLRDEGRMHLSVDFGSAPVEAFEELLDVLRLVGATRVTFGTNASEKTA